MALLREQVGTAFDARCVNALARGARPRGRPRERARARSRERRLARRSRRRRAWASLSHRAVTSSTLVLALAAVAAAPLRPRLRAPAPPRENRPRRLGPRRALRRRPRARRRAARDSPLAGESLAGHMLEHVLIGDAAVALLVLAVRGPLLFFLLPPLAARSVARRAPLRAAAAALARPWVALAAWALVYAAWHVPAAYDYARRPTSRCTRSSTSRSWPRACSSGRSCRPGRPPHALGRRTARVRRRRVRVRADPRATCSCSRPSRSSPPTATDRRAARPAARRARDDGRAAR